MNDVTRLIADAENGDADAAEQLLPLVYGELRRLAAARLSAEAPGQTLEATALVHEAYLRLLGPQGFERQNWKGRRHFFAAAAEAMRRILIEAARRKSRLKHGGGHVRRELQDLPGLQRPGRLIALDEALGRLESADARAAELVKLRYFTGFTNAEAASLLEVSPRKADQIWAFARAWLLEELGDDFD